ncbi:MAG: NAD-dependent epimerase/dehydratase family protein [Anaerolineae bacterium]|nr:NAD-dependent epimerase/dehydratase family protein [Anaerolineae bacterium]
MQPPHAISQSGTRREEEAIFLTGATGFLGRYLLAEMIANHSFTKILALVKGQKDQPRSAIQRLRKILETLSAARGFAISEEGNTLHVLTPGGKTTPVTVIEGDITLPGLGISEPLDFDGVTHICHTAAVTNLIALEELFEQVNITGTQNMLRFAKEHCNNLRLFCYVGTAYDLYSGKDTYLPATHPVEPQSFVNGYSRSKWLARKAVVESGLPHCICLPGIITGCTSDGSLPEDVPLGVIYAPPQGMALLKHVCLPFLPTHTDLLTLDFWALGDEEATLNVIPVDTVALLLERILKRAQSGTVYYLTNPQSLSVGLILETAAKIIGVHGIQLKKDLTNRTSLEKLFIKVLSAYQPFMLGKVNQYDLSNTRTIAPDIPIPSPDKPLLEKLFSYVHQHRRWDYNRPDSIYKESYIEQIQKRFTGDIQKVLTR